MRHRWIVGGSCHLPSSPTTQYFNNQSGAIWSDWSAEVFPCYPKHVGPASARFACEWTSPQPLHVLFCRLPSATSSSTSRASCSGTRCPAHACLSAWPRRWANAPPSTAGLPSSTSSCASCFCPRWCLAFPWRAGRLWSVWAHPLGPCWPLWCLSTSCRIEVLGTYPSGCRHGTSCLAGCILCSPWTVLSPAPPCAMPGLSPAHPSFPLESSWRSFPLPHPPRASLCLLTMPLAFRLQAQTTAWSRERCFCGAHSRRAEECVCV